MHCSFHPYKYPCIKTICWSFMKRLPSTVSWHGTVLLLWVCQTAVGQEVIYFPKCSTVPKIHRRCWVQEQKRWWECSRHFNKKIKKTKETHHTLMVTYLNSLTVFMHNMHSEKKASQRRWQKCVTSHNNHIMICVLWFCETFEKPVTFHWKV